MKGLQLLNGQTLCLTSKHEKLQAVRKPFRQLLSCEAVEDCQVDTDRLGTFSGEVERVGKPSEVAVKKARMGAERQGLRFGLATEGSFGPDPRILTIPSHLEIVAFVDLENSISIVESEFSNKTNLKHLDVSSVDEVGSFLEHVRFPSHTLIAQPLDPIPGVSPPVFKGIRDQARLNEAVAHCLEQSQNKKARIQTDMRAHMNTLRQFVIRKAARKLAARLAEICKSCNYPGWGIVRQQPGLECDECGIPGRWVKSLILGCASCKTEERKPRSDGRTAAPSEVCDFCNP